MQEIHDQNVHAMCTAFVNQGDQSGQSETINVHFDGQNVIIEYKFPTNMGGFKHSEWHTNMLEITAFVWSQQP